MTIKSGTVRPQRDKQKMHISIKIRWIYFLKILGNNVAKFNSWIWNEAEQKSS